MSPDRTPPTDDPRLLATVDLLRRTKAGDLPARDALMVRYLPRLRTWATGRLPMRARSLFDTGDLVQETLLKVLQGMDRIDDGASGNFQAYVRQAVLNRIRDEVRWADRRPGPEGVPETLPDLAPSPLEHAIGAELLESYEKALAGLSEDDRELLTLRIELDYDYAEIATMTGRPSRDAVRMGVQRALRRLAEAMEHER